MRLATAACNFSTSQLQKVVRTPLFFDILTWKCASRHSGVQSFHNFSTSQLQNVVRECRVLYILTSKCASRYSGVQFFHRLQQVVRECCVLYILASNCASRCSGVQFFHIATSKSGPRMLCFVHFDFKMRFSLQRRAIFHFRAQQPPPHPPLYRGYFSTQPTHKSLKNTASRNFPNISRLWIFFLLTFAQLYLLSSDSTSLLCFFIF